MLEDSYLERRAFLESDACVVVHKGGVDER
jgi:hypothetical protein